MKITKSKPKKSENCAAMRCVRCNSINVCPIDKYCYRCGGRRLKKNIKIE